MGARPLRACGAALALVALLLNGMAARALAQSTPAWQQLWADEFTGSRLDATKWTPMLGNGSAFGIEGWGNNQLDTATARPLNLQVAGGHLVLQAVREQPPALPYAPYTSARIRTRGKFGVAPSAARRTIRIEARMLLPRGLGLWPSFFLLPDDPFGYETCSGCGRWGGWPASGEIDVMEAVNGMDWLVSTIHYGASWPGNAMASGGTGLPGGASFAGAWRTFAVEWTTKQMRWYVDGRHFFSAYSGNGTRAGWWSGGAGAGADAPFDAATPFHLLISLALGSERTEFTKVDGRGITPAELNATLASPKQLRVDWVRVYGCAATPRGAAAGCKWPAVPAPKAVAKPAALVKRPAQGG